MYLKRTGVNYTKGDIYSMDNLSEIAQELIKFERDNDMTDNQVAFGSHLSVERIHDIKAGNSEPNDDEAELIERFMKSSNK
ncbi:hypothetical protein FD27_GL000487 [Limosilactobacillus frumenti DSM 13145]|uniref:XRE family transcriptional regulator n=2 Tax=Limosilactobacillus frumenti TaxID=104955 RepID=A0A0R1PC83_9LACO|nr:hypothetical protein FD27_GL000487 [Limosilactobacillus frumenti DSM 13145]